MKTSIKTLTITIEELRAMLTEAAASGNTTSAEKKIEEKIREKSNRLSRQREQRRLRAEQKKAKSKNSGNSESSECYETYEKVIIPLTKDLATALCWLYNRRDHLRTNIFRLIRHLNQAAPDLYLNNLINALNVILNIADQAHHPAAQYLSPNPTHRPQSLTLNF